MYAYCRRWDGHSNRLMTMIPIPTQRCWSRQSRFPWISLHRSDAPVSANASSCAASGDTQKTQSRTTHKHISHRRHLLPVPDYRLSPRDHPSAPPLPTSARQWPSVSPPRWPPYPACSVSRRSHVPSWPHATTPLIRDSEVREAAPQLTKVLSNFSRAFVIFSRRPGITILVSSSAFFCEAVSTSLSSHRFMRSVIPQLVRYMCKSRHASP